MQKDHVSDVHISISNRSCTFLYGYNVTASSLSTPCVAETDIHHTCWLSCGDKKDLFHQMKVQEKGTKKETADALQENLPLAAMAGVK